MAIYLRAYNDNWAISVRKKIKVNLRNAVIECLITKPKFSHFILTNSFAAHIAQGSVRSKKGKRKYKALYS